jgi:hypothetical protein
LTTNPFRYRPNEQPDVDHDGKVVDDWDDNALSNALAWASLTFVPNWCQTPEHWTSRFANKLFTTCPCCMIFRGVVIGWLVSSLFWMLIIALLLASNAPLH